MQGRTQDAEATIARNLPVYTSWGWAEPAAVQQLQKQLSELWKGRR